MGYQGGCGVLHFRVTLNMQSPFKNVPTIRITDLISSLTFSGGFSCSLPFFKVQYPELNSAHFDSAEISSCDKQLISINAA